MKRVVFFGASGFGLRCLEQVGQLPDCLVAGIVTVPQRFRISYRPEGVNNVLHANFAAHAEQRSIPLVSMTGGMRDPEIVDAVRGWRPDLLVVAGWYHLVPNVLRDIAPAFGLHASLLPDYCGGAPLVWAIINGETKTGITLFELGDGVDDGPVIAQAEEPIRDDDTIATLYARIEKRGCELLRIHLPRLARGEAPRLPQDPARRRVFPQRSPEDGRIDWGWPARRIYDFVRAQTRPYPGAFAMLRGSQVTIWKAAESDQPCEATGAGLVRSNRPDSAAVACADGRVLELLEVEYGGTVFSGAAFLARQREAFPEVRLE